MKIKKLLLTAVFTIICVLVLVGCGSSDESGSKSEGNTQDDDTIIVYSNSVSDGRGDWLKEQAAEAGFNIEIVDLGGTDLLNRLLAEKSAPIADVVFGLNQMNFATLKAEDLLISYDPSWVDELGDVPIDEDGMFYPIVEQRVFLIYNSELISEEEAISGWEDLYENEEYHGKYHVPPNMGGATNNAAVYTQLMNYVDESAELGISEEGWEAIKKFFDHGYHTPEGESAIQNMVEGKVPYTFTWLSNVPQIEKEFNFKAGIVNPEYGVPQTLEQVGIINKGEDADYTKQLEFVEWFGSAELQGAWAEQFDTYPVNVKAAEKASERQIEIMNLTTPQKIDYEFINEHLADWIEYIELNIF